MLRCRILFFGVLRESYCFCVIITATVLFQINLFPKEEKMNFPLLPLIGALSGLQDVNIAFSVIVVLVAFVLAGMALVVNAHGPNRYSKSWAQTGLLALGIAVFVSVVGMAYISTIAIIVLWLYLLLYWVLWRYLIKNIIAALEREKPKEKSTTEPIKKPDNIRDHD